MSSYVNGRAVRSALKASVSIAAMGIAALATPASANPAGGTVASGGAAISTSGGNTQVNQSSQNVVINWKSFDIGRNESTQFNQPNAKSVAVNRIGGQNPSQIQGALSSNGRIVLINPNGMVFGKGAKVNVGALIATTAGSNTDGSGKLVFDSAGNANASIVNQGSINASSGMVALVAPNVSNSGTVTAKLGSVTLGASNKFTVDFNGDGLISFATGGEVNRASIANSGSLVGTNVNLTARAAQGMATSVVSTSGIVQASGVNQQGGVIVIDGGNATVQVSGKLNASAGHISVTGSTVNLKSASIDASGTNGGGSIQLGGGKLLAVDKASHLDVSATTSGNAGTIYAAAVTTSFAGSAAARASNGNGGIIETSGSKVDFTGALIDTDATNGTSGLWLVDPVNLTIDAAAAATIKTNIKTTDVIISTSATGSVGPGTASSGAGDIKLKSSIGWSTGAHSLTLSAYHNIVLAGGETIKANTAKSTVTLRADNTGIGAGTIVFHSTNSIKVNKSGGLSIFYNPSSYATPTDFTALINSPLPNIFMLVNTAANLDAVNSGPAGSYALGRDIDYNAAMSPFQLNTFTGVFNGDGHTILHFLGFSPLVYSNSGLLENLSIDASMIGSGGSTGVLVSTNESGGRIVNVHISGTIDMQGAREVGGLAAMNYGLIANSSSSATVTGGSDASGLVASNFGTITHSYATGNVTGEASAMFVAGLVGTNYGSGVIDHSWAMGAVAGDVGIGGLVGSNMGQIAQSYAIGSVTSTGVAGGLVAQEAGGTITQSWAAGLVTGAFLTGGLIGGPTSSPETAAFWDIATSGQTIAGGLGPIAGVVGLTHADAMKKKSYAGFDFKHDWQIVNGVTYPTLQGMLNYTDFP
jgi:filamentous hemagglutinin family protein